jgi:hypothetical protein
MGNPIKYSTTGDTLSLKKGNFYFGTGDVGKGESTGTRYYNGVTPSVSGYTIYSYNSGQTSNISYHSSDTNSDLITYTNTISGQNFTGVTQCLNWYSTQNNYVCVNRDYNEIQTSGLTLLVDAGFTPSYATTGNTWYDISYSGYNGTLTNSPTYSSANGGTLVFDGVDDYIDFGSSGSTLIQNKTAFTISTMFKLDELAVLRPIFGTLAYGCGGNLGIVSSNGSLTFYNDYGPWPATGGTCYSVGFSPYVVVGEWIYAVATYDGSTTKLYGIKNGAVSITSGTTKTGVTNTISRNLRLFQGGSYNSKGSVISANIYNRVLSQSEILENYQSLIPRLVNSDIVTNGLVNYLDSGYKGSYPTSGTTWYDISGYGRNGTLTNGPTYSNISGGTIVFDGTDDYVTLGSQNLVTNNFTINLWYNLNTNTTKEHFLFSIGYASANSFLIVANSTLGGSQSISSYYVNTGGSTTGRTINSATLTNTQIVNLTYTRNNGLNVIYINGVEQTSRTFTESLSLGSSLQYILGYAIPRNKTSAYLQGNIYISQIYDRGLSSSEVLQNFNAQKGRFGL